MIPIAVVYLGLAVMILGSIGLVRFPDIYSRLQASSASDTVGVVIILLGLMLHQGLNPGDLRILLLMVFILITGPIVTHSIAKAAFLSKRKPYSDREERD